MALFNVFALIFPLMFMLVFGIIIFTLIKGIGQWNKNNHSPQLTVFARVVTKRGQVSHHRRGGANDHMHTTTSTTYYVTFEVESGDRMEFHVSGPVFGQLVEGDEGWLTFQGTRYLDFQRHIDKTSEA